MWAKYDQLNTPHNLSLVPIIACITFDEQWIKKHASLDVLVKILGKFPLLF